MDVSNSNQESIDRSWWKIKNKHKHTHAIHQRIQAIRVVELSRVQIKNAGN